MAITRTYGTSKDTGRKYVLKRSKLGVAIAHRDGDIVVSAKWSKSNGATAKTVLWMWKEFYKEDVEEKEAETC